MSTHSSTLAATGKRAHVRRRAVLRTARRRQNARARLSDRGNSLRTDSAAMLAATRRVSNHNGLDSKACKSFENDICASFHHSRRWMSAAHQTSGGRHANNKASRECRNANQRGGWRGGADWAARLYFSDIRPSRIYRLDPNGKIDLVREQTNGANGLALTHDGLTGSR